MLADAVEIAPRLTKQPAGPVFIGAKFVLDALQRGILLGLARVELIGHRARSDQRDRRIDRTQRGGEAIVLEHEIIERRAADLPPAIDREEHTSALQSLMRISY